MHTRDRQGESWMQGGSPGNADDAHETDGDKDGSHRNPEDEVGAVGGGADLLQQRGRCFAALSPAAATYAHSVLLEDIVCILDPGCIPIVHAEEIPPCQGQSTSRLHLELCSDIEAPIPTDSSIRRS